MDDEGPIEPDSCRQRLVDAERELDWRILLFNIGLSLLTG
jgi:hypothetical protein